MLLEWKSILVRSDNILGPRKPLRPPVVYEHPSWKEKLLRIENEIHSIVGTVLNRLIEVAMRLRYMTHRRSPRHHVVVGAGTLALLSIVIVLGITGKSRKVRADATAVITIMAPREAAFMLVPELPELPTLGSALANELPRGEVAPKLAISVSSNDGLPLQASGSAGLYRRSTVLFTAPLAQFAQDLSQYLANNNMQAMVTSGFRTGDRQLELIKEEVARQGMISAFPALVGATVADRGAWLPAWQWLHARRIPIDPPADYVTDEGNQVGSSLHMKGMALDLVSDNLSALSQAVLDYANHHATGASGLHITAILRESRCVHLSLAH